MATDLAPWLQWAIAFVLMAFTDVCWVLYTKNAANSKPFPAATWAVMLFLMGGLATVAYTTNHWLLIPSAAGAFAGTFLAASWKGGWFAWNRLLCWFESHSWVYPDFTDDSAPPRQPRKVCVHCLQRAWM